jgi:hypothetical protein
MSDTKQHGRGDVADILKHCQKPWFSVLFRGVFHREGPPCYSYEPLPDSHDTLEPPDKPTPSKKVEAAPVVYHASSSACHKSIKFVDHIDPSRLWDSDGLCPLIGEHSNDEIAAEKESAIIISDAGFADGIIQRREGIQIPPKSPNRRRLVSIKPLILGLQSEEAPQYKNKFPAICLCQYEPEDSPLLQTPDLELVSPESDEEGIFRFSPEPEEDT